MMLTSVGTKHISSFSCQKHPVSLSETLFVFGFSKIVVLFQRMICHGKSLEEGYMTNKAWIPMAGVIAILLIGIVTAQSRDSSTEQQGMMGGSMASHHTDGMGDAMKGMNMKDMEKMHGAMGKYLKDSNAPKDLQEMHAQCGKMMG